MQNDGADAHDGREHADPDQGDGNRRDRDRRRRMHDDAQRAMVGGAFLRMNVRHLDYGQQREQDQAHHRRGIHRAGSGAARAGELCPESRQKT
jgi:hypothetical protein